KEKSFITMYYEIKGPLKDPNVDPVPIKSIGKNILGIFQRLFEAPIMAITPDRKEEEKEGKGRYPESTPDKGTAP
ncbi:MAG: hypothetical protein HY880_08640, partial [Deltaproteobacteria bacterium]|nr:hypothetical protein [Deltaproteobacteria bacterium]